MKIAGKNRRKILPTSTVELRNKRIAFLNNGKSTDVARFAKQGTRDGE